MVTIDSLSRFTSRRRGVLVAAAVCAVAALGVSGAYAAGVALWVPLAVGVGVTVGLVAVVARSRRDALPSASATRVTIPGHFDKLCAAAGVDAELWIGAADDQAYAQWRWRSTAVVELGAAYRSAPGFVTAGVMAHEVAHLARRDGRRTALMRSVSIAVELAVLTTTNLVLGVIAGYVAFVAAVAVTETAERAAARRHELAADAYGAQLLEQIGFVPEGFGRAAMAAALTWGHWDRFESPLRRLRARHPETTVRFRALLAGQSAVAVDFAADLADVAIGVTDPSPRSQPEPAAAV